MEQIFSCTKWNSRTEYRKNANVDTIQQHEVNSSAQRVVTHFGFAQIRFICLMHSSTSTDSFTFSVCTDFVHCQCVISFVPLVRSEFDRRQRPTKRISLCTTICQLQMKWACIFSLILPNLMPQSKFSFLLLSDFFSNHVLNTNQLHNSEWISGKFN